MPALIPGGARDGDEDAVQCATRETCEEMGVCADDIEVLGRLPDRISTVDLFRTAPGRSLARFAQEPPRHTRREASPVVATGSRLPSRPS